MGVDEGKDSSSGKSDSKGSGNTSGKSDSKDSGTSGDKNDSKGSGNISGKSDSKGSDNSSDKSDSKGSGNDDNNNGASGKANGKGPDKSKEKEKEKVAKSDNDTKEVRKLFDNHVKAGDPHRINSGLSMENTKNWFEDADMIDDKFDISEAAFEKAFKATAKGEDKDKVEFLEFIEFIEMLADEISKTPQELYNQLLSAEKPVQ